MFCSNIFERRKIIMACYVVMICLNFTITVILSLRLRYTTDSNRNTQLIIVTITFLVVTSILIYYAIHHYVENFQYVNNNTLNNFNNFDLNRLLAIRVEQNPTETQTIINTLYQMFTQQPRTNNDDSLLV